MSDLNDLTKEELLERAREADVEGRSSMSKEELVEALSSPEVSGQKPDFTTPRVDQGSDNADREVSDRGFEVAGGGTADQSSMSGTPATTGGPPPAGPVIG